MKIEKPLKDVTFEIQGQKFSYASTGTPQIEFKVRILNEMYDPFIEKVSLSDKSIKFALHKVRLMTGWAGESFLDLCPEMPGYVNVVGRKFKADISMKEYNGRTFPRIEFPSKDKMTIEQLKELDNKHKQTLVAHSAEYKDSIPETEPDGEINIDF
jgi:hypothetical protein